MISRKNRFHGFNSLRHVYHGGKTARGPLFAVKAIPNPRRQEYRAAVVVSRKVNKSAVVRNRIRRQLYESLRLAGISRPFDIVLTVFHDSIAQKPQTELAGQLKKQLKDLGIL